MSHIPKIIIKPIDPENQRYPTCGDYLYDREDDTLTIFVSRMGDWRSELAVAIHEMFESVVCIFDDVSTSDIDLFDMDYERKRTDGDVSEPGDSKDAPYHHQHVAATFVEREVCSKLNLEWVKHEEIVNESC